MLVAYDNDWPAGIICSVQGHIECSYARLVEVFGPPNIETDKYKSDAEWLLRDTVTHEYATIYNYKDDKNYMGKDGLSVEQITDWHVGGKSKQALKLVAEAIQ